MRTTYFANKKRIQEALEKKQIYTSKWAHYESMIFLDKPEDKSSDKSPDSDVSETDDPELNDAPEIDVIVDSTQSVSNESKWTLEEEEKLIFFYEDHPDLWDHKRENYKKQQKGQIMDDLIESLDSKFNSKYTFYSIIILKIIQLFVGKDVITKFAALKKKYFSEVKKIDQTSASGAGLDDVHETDFIHFQNLNFLKVCTEVDKTISFLDLEMDDYFIANKENIDIDSSSSSCSSSMPETPLTSQKRSTSQLSTPLPSSSKRSLLDYTPKPPKRIKKKQKSDPDSLIIEAMSTLRDLKKDESNKSDKTDECQMAGSFVSFTLSTLDADIRVEAMAHIIQYLLSLKKK